MRQITQDIVTARAGRPVDQRPDDLLERMLSAADPLTGEKLSEENVQYQLATFLIAGQLTTSELMPITLYNLMHHQAVLSRVAAEVDAVRHKLGEFGLTPTSSTPQAVEAEIASDQAKFGPMVKQLGIKVS